MQKTIPASDHLCHIRISDSWIIYGSEDQILSDHRNAGCGAHINNTVTLRNAANPGRAKDISAPHTEAVVLLECNTAVICADPQPVVRIGIQADNTADTRLGIHAFKCIAVIADQAAVAADPDKAIVCLGDGICFGSGQAVFIVVKNCGIVFAVPDGVHCTVFIQYAGCVYGIDQRQNQHETDEHADHPLYSSDDFLVFDHQ